ncbi:MAG: sulfotransferase [Chloroflexota bacterium]
MLKRISKKKILHHSAMRVAPVLARNFHNYYAQKVQNPIFLIGCFRSGTSLLSHLLGLHRDIAEWSEANEVLDPVWYPWRPENQKRYPLEYDPYTFNDQWWADMQSRQQEIRAKFGAYQSLRGKAYFLNKSPYNTFRLPQLLEIFPNARFIHIYRDGRAVAFSHAKKLTNDNKLREWPEPEQTRFKESFDELAIWMSGFWKQSLEEVEKQDEALGLTKQGLMMTLTYESLCADSDSQLAQICQFVGLDQTRFLPTLAKEKVIKQNHKWQEGLDKNAVSKMVAKMEPVLTQYNYL